jgi:hypothetical protein
MVRQNKNVSVIQHHARDFAIFDSAAQDKHGHAVENFLLDEPCKRPGTIGRRVASTAKVVADLVCHFDTHVSAVGDETFLNFAEADVDDAADLAFGEAVEDDDGGDTIEELGEELVAQGAHDKFPGGGINLAVGRVGAG